MLLSKVFRLARGHPGFHHELHGSLYTQATRGSVASLRNHDTDDGLSTPAQIPDSMPEGDHDHAPDTQAASSTSAALHDVTMLKIQMEDIKSGLQNLGQRVDKRFDDVNKRFDHLMILITGGAVLKGGFDIHRDERRYSAVAKQA
ncbi:hypothetical protein HOY80DRAFT_1034540 [Tuber brumale]|nr:hypothetical protein HOY80DRAFT_1034540 [Tuber brumale]